MTRQILLAVPDFLIIATAARRDGSVRTKNGGQIVAGSATVSVRTQRSCVSIFYNHFLYMSPQNLLEKYVDNLNEVMNET